MGTRINEAKTLKTLNPKPCPPPPRYIPPTSRLRPPPPFTIPPARHHHPPAPPASVAASLAPNRQPTVLPPSCHAAARPHIQCGCTPTILCTEPAPPGGSRLLPESYGGGSLASRRDEGGVVRCMLRCACEGSIARRVGNRASFIGAAAAVGVGWQYRPLRHVGGHYRFGTPWGSATFKG
jgi:hypothetical protein